MYPDEYSNQKRIRVLIAKPGLDGHDRGAKVVSLALKEAGMEVIYTGLHKTIDEIVSTALEEDVDVIGLSILSGAHMKLCPRVLEFMKQYGIGEKPVFVGGIIPEDDALELKKMGIFEVFGPGTSLEKIIDSMRKIVK